MAYWRLYYHIVWATKERQPLITAKLEPVLYGFLVGKVESLGCKVQAIGGIENHLHLTTSIPPSIAVAEFVRRIKGSSSHHLNNDLGYTIPQFSWQGGYGIFSVSPRLLDPPSNMSKTKNCITAKTAPFRLSRIAAKKLINKK